MLSGMSFPKTTQYTIQILIQLFGKLIMNVFQECLIIRAKHLPVYSFSYLLVHLFYELVLYLQVSGYEEMNPLKDNDLCNLLISEFLNFFANHK